MEGRKEARKEGRKEGRKGMKWATLDLLRLSQGFWPGVIVFEAPTQKEVRKEGRTERRNGLRRKLKI